jgi:hypothetical protein
MKLSEIIALIVVILGLAGAFQEFFAVDFFTKLVALAVGGGIVLWVAARRLTDWIRIRSKNELPMRIPRRSKRKLAVAIFALFIICIAFSAAACFVLRFYAINIEVALGADHNSLDLWIHGSHQVASKVTVLVPPSNEFECEPIRNTGDDAQVVLVDWESSNPQLQITNFSYSQHQGISCSPPPTIDRFAFRIEPATVEVVLPERRLKYKILFVILGGVLWIASSLFVIFRSR